MKKLRYLALLLVAALLFTGCNVLVLNPERDGAQIVAVVNGENITKKQVYDAAGMTWDDLIDSWDKEQYEDQKDSTLDSLIQEIVIKQKAHELGYYTFTDDERKQMDDAFASYIKDTYDKALADYQEKAKTDASIKPEEKANEAVDAYLQQNGYTRESYRKNQEDNMAYSKAKKAVTDPVTATDADVQTYYSELLAEEKTQFDASPADVMTANQYSLFGYPPVIYFPTDGFMRVKHILVALPDDVQENINNLRKEEKEEEANKLRDEELKKIETAAKEALTKAKGVSGDLEKMSALMVEISADKSMTAEDDGILLYKDSTDNNGLMKEFNTAALALTEVAKPSELVATDYGYHIIWLTEKIAKGDVPLEKVKDILTEIVKANNQNTAWSDQVTKWMEEMKPKIKEYRKRLHIS